MVQTGRRPKISKNKQLKSYTETYSYKNSKQVKFSIRNKKVKNGFGKGKKNTHKNENLLETKEKRCNR